MSPRKETLRLIKAILKQHPPTDWEMKNGWPYRLVHGKVVVRFVGGDWLIFLRTGDTETDGYWVVPFTFIRRHLWGAISAHARERDAAKKAEAQEQLRTIVEAGNLQDLPGGLSGPIVGDGKVSVVKA